MKKATKKNQNIINLLKLLGVILFFVIVLVFFKNTVAWNIVVLMLILTVLVFVHEGGHFLAAKRFGVYVYEFAIGMGTKLIGFKRKNDPTEYSVRLLPIGGYCQLAGEDVEDDDKLSKDSFMCNKKKIPRAIILCAGVFNNFLLAIILLFFISLIWGSTEQSSIIAGVMPDSPAYEAGLVEGDEIIELNGYSISTVDKLSLVSMLKNDKEYNEYIVLHQDGTESTYQLTPAEYMYVNDGKEAVRVTEENTKEKIIADYQLDEKSEPVNLIGIEYSQEYKHGFINAIKFAFTKFWTLISSMLLVVWSLITGKLGLGSLSGPVGMYKIVDEIAAVGLYNIIYLTAYLSINLGVINILPIPAMDGGRLFFVLIEAITHKKVNPKIENAINSIGFILLMILMLFITYRDIFRLF